MGDSSFLVLTKRAAKLITLNAADNISTRGSMSMKN
jgi:hypothetical protein